jgi:hypothetical protein
MTEHEILFKSVNHVSSTSTHIDICLAVDTYVYISKQLVRVLEPEFVASETIYLILKNPSSWLHEAAGKPTCLHGLRATTDDDRLLKRYHPPLYDPLSIMSTQVAFSSRKQNKPRT